MPTFLKQIQVIFQNRERKIIATFQVFQVLSVNPTRAVQQITHL